MEMNHIGFMGSLMGHVGRVWVIAWHAFTQLVRMKVFYFLAFFAGILILSNFFNLPQHEGPESMGVNVLYLIKSWSMGAMTLFSVVMSIVATALLIPKDIEDRTLYTILAKPVPRIDYLVGKLMGVLLLLAVSLLVMDLLMTGILHLRTNLVVEQRVELAKVQGFSDADIERMREEVQTLGSTWSLQGAVVAIFLRGAIMASMALMISTFSSSTLFTTIVGFLIFFIGHFQADARAVYLAEDAGMSDSVVVRGVSLVISLVLPDFQLFNVIDGVIEGQVMPLVILGKLVMVACFYGIFHLLASWFLFARKEF